MPAFDRSWPHHALGLRPTPGIGREHHPNPPGRDHDRPEGRADPDQLQEPALWSGAKQHIIPLDTTIPGANQATNRTAVHLHGGLVPWISDGGPFDWFDPYGMHGTSFLNNQVLNPRPSPNSAEYYYPLNQSARFLWYHDHALGITRLNAYAGIASGLLLRDAFEGNLRNQGLPDFIEAGGNELPLVIQDKVFVGPTSAAQDPTWFDINLQNGHAEPRQPVVRPRLRSGPTGTSGDGGLHAPESIVHPRVLRRHDAGERHDLPGGHGRRRAAIACASSTPANARFLNLQLYVADGSPNGITLDCRGTADQHAIRERCHGRCVLAADRHRGRLPGEAGDGPEQRHRSMFRALPERRPGSTRRKIKSLLVAPAERPDVIVDFKEYAGKSIILYNDAPAPFPGGGPRDRLLPGPGQRQPGQREHAPTATAQHPGPHAVQRGRGDRQPRPAAERSTRAPT